MEISEIKKLKLNATKIHNTLLSNNKNLRKLRLTETSFIKNQNTQEKRTLKEQFIEKSSGVKKALTTIKDKIMTGPMSIFDKIKELFGIILVGFLVNALPGILKKLKNFFDQNPGIIDAIKDTFKILGDLGYGLIQLVNSLTPKDQEKTISEEKQVDSGINSLDGELSLIDRLMNNLFNLFGAPAPTPQPSSQYNPGGGRQQYNQSRSSAPAPAAKPAPPAAPAAPAPAAPAPAAPTPAANPSRPGQKLSKGGTVQKLARGGRVDIDPGSYNFGAESGKKTKVTGGGAFARPGGTAKGKKARESVDAFDDFKSNTTGQSILLGVQKSNNEKFSKLTTNLSIFTKLMKDKKDDDKDKKDDDKDKKDDDKDKKDDDDSSPSEQPSGQSSGQPEPPGSSGAAGKWKPILDLIGSAEGGYESVNYGSGPGKIPGLTKMTVREAFNATETYRKKYGGTGAMGKYQIVNSPLSRAKSAGLNIDKDLFSPENQDKIGVYLIEKERKITSDLIKNNPTEAAMKLSQLFAGIPVLAPTYSGYAGRTVKRGESFYQGFNGNKATVTADAVEAAFKKFSSAPDSSSTPSSTPSSRPSPPKPEPVITQKDLDKLKNVIKSGEGSGEKVKIPGVGTYVRGKDGIFAVDKYFDENGERISVKEFYDRLEKVKKENNLTSSSLTSTQQIAQIDSRNPRNPRNLQNLQLESENDSNVVVATIQQPYIVYQEVVRYIKNSNPGSISQGGSNVNNDQLMAFKLV